MRFLESAKTDLILIRSLLAQAKPLPSISIWKVFVGIIVFLSLIGFTLFFFWHKRVTIIQSTSMAASEEEGEGILADPAKDGKAESEKEEGEKKISPEDIEKMISGEE